MKWQYSGGDFVEGKDMEWDNVNSKKLVAIT